MPFRPTTNTKITLSGAEYRFAEHPAAKGMPYGQTGRRATVYQMQDARLKFYALKVFTNFFRTAQTESGAQRIAAFAGLPGLQVCSRTVLTRQNHPALLGQYPDLEYAVLMPWVAGQTWQEILLARQPLTQEQSLSLARSFSSVLATMEQKNLAHCDLSGPNVLVSGAASKGPEINVALVDVEDLYAPGLEKPEKLPGGSAGYGHKTAAVGLWSAAADRFAGAVLLAEMLGWCDERVRRIAVGEQYFDSHEVQQPSDRFNLLRDTLEKRFGHPYAETFTAAWFSPTLQECPRLAEWTALLGNGALPGPQAAPSKPPELNDAGRYLFDSLKAKLAENDLGEAEKLVNALRALAPDFEAPAQLLEQARQATAQEQARRDELAHLEKELAEKRQTIQALNAEKDALQAKITEAEQECVLIEGQIGQVKASFAPAKPEAQDVKPKQPAPTSAPVLPSLGRKTVKLSVHETFKHLSAVRREPVEAALFFSDGKGFVTIAQDKKARIWTFGKNEIDVAYKVSFQSAPKFMVKSSNSCLLAIAGNESGWVNVWDVKNENEPHKLIVSFEMARGVTALAFSPSGSTLIVGTSGGNVSLYSMEKLSFERGVVISEVNSLVFSPDGKYLAAGLSEGGIQLLNATDYTVIAQTHVAEDPSLVFSTQSRFLCCGDSGGTIRLFDVPNLRTLLSFSPAEIYPVKSHPVTSLALSPDDELLATAMENGDIHLWRTTDGKLLDTTHEHSDSVSGLDFHPSGKYLLSGSYDGRAIIWDIK